MPQVRRIEVIPVTLTVTSNTAVKLAAQDCANPAGSAALPRTVVCGVSMNAVTGTPTHIEFWLEFRANENDDWRICRQNNNGTNPTKVKFTAADVAAAIAENILAVVPEGAQVRFCYQGNGCDGSNYFTITDASLVLIP